MGSDGVPRRSRDPRFPAASRGGWRVTVYTGTTIWTQPTQPQAPAVGRATPAGGATLNAAGLSQAAMATPSPSQLGPRVVRAPDPWTYDRDQTWAGATAVRAKRGRHI
jgi:hypothetical protein